MTPLLDRRSGRLDLAVQSVADEIFMAVFLGAELEI
jgi:hypothetical protein